MSLPHDFAVETAQNYYEALKALVESVGYSGDNVQVITDPKKIRGMSRIDKPDTALPTAVVVVNIASLEIDASSVSWDGQHFNLRKYGWQGPRDLMTMDIIRDGVMGFWEDP